MTARGIRKIWGTMMAASIVISVGAYGVVTWALLQESYSWPTVAQWLGKPPSAQAQPDTAMPRIVPATLTSDNGDAGFAATLTVIRDGATIVCRIDPADPSRVACPETRSRVH